MALAPPLHLGREVQELAGEVLVDEEKLQASRSESGGHQSFGIVGLRLGKHGLAIAGFDDVARGIYHHIGAGQAADLAMAARYTGQRLHFAGEHLAQTSSGIEGALERGERAARAVLTS